MGKSLPSHPSSLKLTLWDSGPVNRHVKMAMLPLQLCSLIVQANEQVICGGRHNHTVAAMLSRSMNTDVIRATFFANSDKDEDLRMKMFGSRYDVYDRFEPPNHRDLTESVVLLKIDLQRTCAIACLQHRSAVRVVKRRNLTWVKSTCFNPLMKVMNRRAPVVNHYSIANNGT